MFFCGKRPKTLGPRNGNLSPCPVTPNCVSSHCENDRHYIAPIKFKLDPIEEMKLLNDLLGTFTGLKVIEFRDTYLYAECKSRWLGFVDDLEFYWNSDEQVCHVRSASRLGISDLGQNRRRVDAIRSAFEKHPRS